MSLRLAYQGFRRDFQVTFGRDRFVRTTHENRQEPIFSGSIPRIFYPACPSINISGYLLFLLWNFVFFLSLSCLCLLIFFLRHFLTFPTNPPPSKNSNRRAVCRKKIQTVRNVYRLLPAARCLFLSYSLAWSMKASSCMSTVDDSDPS